MHRVSGGAAGVVVLTSPEVSLTNRGNQRTQRPPKTLVTIATVGQARLWEQ